MYLQIWKTKSGFQLFRTNSPEPTAQKLLTGGFLFKSLQFDEELHAEVFEDIFYKCISHRHDNSQEKALNWILLCYREYQVDGHHIGLS